MGNCGTKSVVHSVRTILTDYGANTGYIISRKRFQKGAHEAAKNSNLHLFNFNQFQTEFRAQWVNNVVDELEMIGYPLRKYSDPMESFFDKYYDGLDKAKQNEFHQLQNEYDNISMMTYRIYYKNAMNGQLDLENLDKVIENNLKTFPKDIPIYCLMDYFEYLKKISTEGVSKFDNLFGQRLRKN
ncbi:MAG: restriction endonuclease [Bacteroidetes bacterium]|nr:restriction endonuclease [Bacteroidota bacterium]